MKKSGYIPILKFASLSCLYEEFYFNWVAIASCRGLLFWRLNHQKRLRVFQQLQIESLNERVRSTQKSCHKMSQLREIRSQNQKPSAVVLHPTSSLSIFGLSSSTIRTAACQGSQGQQRDTEKQPQNCWLQGLDHLHLLTEPQQRAKAREGSDKSIFGGGHVFNVISQVQCSMHLS